MITLLDYAFVPFAWTIIKDYCFKGIILRMHLPTQPLPDTGIAGEPGWCELCGKWCPQWI